MKAMLCFYKEGAWLQPESQGDWLFTVGGDRLRLIKSTTGSKVPSSTCTRKPDEISCWDPDHAPRRGSGRTKTCAGRRSIRLRKHETMTFIGCFKGIPCWQLVSGSDRFRKENGTSRDTASRGPTTIVAPESQFRTCPSDHGLYSTQLLNIIHTMITSARTETPQNGDRNKSDQRAAAGGGAWATAGGGRLWRRGKGAAV
ncbi:hypothetical protein F511_09839 [Dorcoceras hygrometricum]|uniref:Uncharacterized protein n=1 Tax=Dorcoceras hygrometricum TaxID=472368 RepID=A0A2Z7CFH0_9LAMI|nr:hypothetical protein F511_09839 [Dorcoceras hygrometricum]